MLSKTQSKHCDGFLPGGGVVQVGPYVRVAQYRQLTLGQTTNLTYTVEEPAKIELIGIPCTITITTKGNEELSKVTGADVGTKGIKFTPEIKGVTFTAESP